MTAILGLSYLDGILMMADTEESLGGDAKSECDKLYRFIFPSGTVITGGAGDSHLIDCANQDLHQFFAHKVKVTPQEILETLNGFALKFQEEAISPLKGFQYEPGLEMLIAVNCNKQSTLLFKWKQSRVIWIAPPQHTSIGAGVVQIHPMLRDVQFAASKECMLFHGLRMMYHAKRAVAGVGGKTEAVALQNDGATHYFGTIATQKIEELIINYDHFITGVLDGNVSTIAVTDTRIEPEMEANVEKFFADLPRLLKDYRQAYKDILNPQLAVQRSKGSSPAGSRKPRKSATP
jgi:hypothetical protein